jgi:hypothetical protein
LLSGGLLFSLLFPKFKVAELGKEPDKQE